MTANVDDPPSPLTPSRLGTPPPSMADPVEPLAWDDMSAALEKNVFGNLYTDNDDSDLFAPVNFPSFPVPDLEQTKANTCDAPEQGTAHVDSVLRGYQGKRNVETGSFRRNKKHFRTFEKGPHVVDGHVDQFPRLKNVTRLQENNEFNRTPYRRVAPPRRFNKYSMDSDEFRPRRRNYNQVVPVAKGFHDMPANAQAGYWNSPEFSGVPFGSHIPQVPRYRKNKTGIRKMENIGMNPWMPNSAKPNYTQHSMPGQFIGFPQGFGPCVWPQMFHQLMVPQVQPMPQQAPTKPLVPRTKFSPRTSCMQEREVPAQQDMPRKIIETPPQNDGIPETVSPSAGDGRGASEKRIKENAKNDSPAPARPNDLRKRNSKSTEVANNGASGSRPVPDVELLRRTLENIKKGNALKSTKQSRKARKPHPEAGAKHQRSGNETPPFGQPTRGTHPEDQEIKRSPRLAPRGGIQKQPFPRQNRGLPSGESRYNQKWRPSWHGEDAGNRSPHWMQSRIRHGNMGWRGNDYRNVRRGGFRRNNYRHSGGQNFGPQNGGPEGFGNRKSVFSRLGWNRTQGGMPPNFVNMDNGNSENHAD